MAAAIGRQVEFLWGGNSPADEIQGIREKSVAMNGEPVDVTSDDNDGWRELLTVAAENQVSISLSGVTKDNRLKTAWFTGARTEPCTIRYPDGGQISGNFFLSTYTDTGPYNDALTFEAEVVSTGIVTYTPPA